MSKKDTGFMTYAGPSLMILSILKEKARYGAEIAEELEARSDGALQFQYGTMYPLLRKLQHDGLVEFSWDTTSSNAALRVYTLTAKGRSDVERQTQKWLKYADSVRKVLLTD